MKFIFCKNCHYGDRHNNLKLTLQVLFLCLCSDLDTADQWLTLWKTLFNGTLFSNRGFARQPCCMAGTMKMFCIRKNICSHRKKNLLLLPCNMAAMQNLYRTITSFHTDGNIRSCNRREVSLVILRYRNLLQTSNMLAAITHKSVNRMRNNLPRHAFLSFSSMYPDNLHPRALLIGYREEQSKACLIGAFMLAREVSRSRNVQIASAWL